jgi:hypothetical protein
MGLALEAAIVLEGGRADGEGVSHPAQALLRANDDFARDHFVVIKMILESQVESIDHENQ